MDSDLLSQYLKINDLARPLGGVDNRVFSWQVALELLVYVVFVAETAHESAAPARYLGGVQGSPLVLGHLHGNGLQPLQEAPAAEFPPAVLVLGQEPGLIPYAYLSHLNPGVVLLGQFPYEFTEVYPLLGHKVEDYLFPVQEVLHSSELHGEAFFVYLFLAEGKCLIDLFLFNLSETLVVFWRELA